MPQFERLMKDMKRKENLSEELSKDIKDEKEAVEGYDKTIKATTDENTKNQLNKIRKEELAHEAYLKRAKTNPNAQYHE